jgi:hypothetical protein
MQLIVLLSALAKLLSDPETLAVAQKFIEWFKTLSKPQQLAYASKFEGFGSYGCPHGDDCPDCPPEFDQIEATLYSAMKGE